MIVEKIIQTDRLTLTPIAWADLVFLFRLLGNSHVRRFLGGPVPLPARLLRLGAYLRGHSMVGIWMVRNNATKKAIGIIELTPHKNGTNYEISYQFHPLSWGKGFASEAANRIIRYARSDLGFESLIAETQTANSRSCRLLEELGFVRIDRIMRFGEQQTIYSIG